MMGEHLTVTEVVSLNVPFLQRAGALDLDHQCVASHPMAGGTGTGFIHSREGLFQGARVWISPGSAQEDRVQGVEGLWRALGGDPQRVEAIDHDRLMAWVSHLPQLAGNALAAALSDAGIRPHDLGPGGRDTTRLAGSGPVMWKEILGQDPETLIQGLESLEGYLARIRASLAQGRVDEVEALMSLTREWLEVEE
jgi:prephenate dehydrogenase